MPEGQITFALRQMEAGLPVKGMYRMLRISLTTLFWGVGTQPTASTGGN